MVVCELFHFGVISNYHTWRNRAKLDKKGQVFWGSLYYEGVLQHISPLVHYEGRSISSYPKIFMTLPNCPQGQPALGRGRYFQIFFWGTILYPLLILNYMYKSPVHDWGSTYGPKYCSPTIWVQWGIVCGFSRGANLGFQHPGLTKWQFGGPIEAKVR